MVSSKFEGRLEWKNRNESSQVLSGRLRPSVEQARLGVTPANEDMQVHSTV